MYSLSVWTLELDVRLISIAKGLLGKPHYIDHLSDLLHRARNDWNFRSPSGSCSWYVYRANWVGEKFQARRFRSVLIPARQEIANKILASACEINPLHATVEASLRIIAPAPRLKLRQVKRFARERGKIKSCSRYSVVARDRSTTSTQTFWRTQYLIFRYWFSDFICDISEVDRVKYMINVL